MPLRLYGNYDLIVEFFVEIFGLQLGSFDVIKIARIFWFNKISH
jgi:hypothetical protein